jgi:hypothetical protein
VFEEIASAASAESPLWAEALRPQDERAGEVVFSPLGPEQHALGIETIYEGYLVHYGHSRLFAPADDDTALLLGDYLYAQGLVRVAETGDVAAVADLAELISLCGQAKAEKRAGDGAAWAATAALLGRGTLDDPRDELRVSGDPGALDAAARSAAGDDVVGRALSAHARFVL